MFLSYKDETFSLFQKFVKMICIEKNTTILSIRSDHGIEFENSLFKKFCSEHGISHNFSTPRTPYELWHGRKPNISYFHIFGCKYFIHNNDKDNLEKFDAKADEGIFLGYSTSSKAYRIFNKRSLIVEESIYVVFDEFLLNKSK